MAPAARTPHPLSVSPISPPPSPATAPHTIPPACQAPPLALLSNEPVGSLSGSARHNLTASPYTPPLPLPGSAPPALQTTPARTVAPLRIPHPSHSSSPAGAAVLRR